MHMYHKSRYRARKKYYEKEENKEKKRIYMREYAKRKKYDAKKLKVGKYKVGAFGMQVRANDDEIARYVFNICMEVFSREFRELGESS